MEFFGKDMTFAEGRFGDPSGSIRHSTFAITQNHWIETATPDAVVAWSVSLL